jgi:hypothetical protein
MYDEEFVIFNPTLGVHDRVTLGEVNMQNDKTTVWLDEPYEMVGPLYLDQLKTQGQINFAQCIVLTTKRWQQQRVSLLQEAYKRQRELHEEHLKDIHRFNREKHYNDKEHRELLCLPLEGELEATQIKAAYRKISKKVHPDLGGSHEEFIQITIARDSLLKKFSL